MCMCVCMCVCVHACVRVLKLWLDLGLWRGCSGGFVGTSVGGFTRYLPSKVGPHLLKLQLIGPGVFFLTKLVFAKPNSQSTQSYQMPAITSLRPTV